MAQYESQTLFDTTQQYLKDRQVSQQQAAAANAQRESMVQTEQQRLRDQYTQQQAAAAPPEPGPLARAVDLLGRPRMAVQGAIQAGLQGQNPIQGLVSGFQGQGPQNFASVLQQQGVGTAPVGPFDTRGIAGLAGDIATDPLTYIPIAGWAGKGLNVAGKALGIGRDIAPTVARDALAPATEFGVNQMLAARAPTAVAQGLQKVEQAPVAGGVIKKAADIVNPVVSETDPIKQALNAGAAVEANIPNQVEQIMAPVKALQRLPMDPNGRIPLTGGEQRAATDVWKNPDAYAGRIPESEVQVSRLLAQTYQQTITPYLDRVAKFAVAHPDEAPSFQMELRTLKDGESHIPIRYANRAGEEALVGDQPLTFGSKATFQNERVFNTEEQAIQAGFTPQGPVKSTEMAIGEILQKQAQMDLIDKIIPMGTRTAETGFTPPGTVIKSAWFPRDEAIAIGKALTDQPNAAIKWLSDASSVFRTLSLSLDVSGPMIQGLPVLLSRPGAWANAFGASLRQFVQPRSVYQYMAKPESQQIYSIFPTLARGTSTTALESGGDVLAQLARKVPAIGRPLGAAIERGTQSFDTFGTVARTEMAKPFLRMASEDPAMAVKIGDYLNHMTGVISTQGMGISATQRAAESAFLLAPRYLRATAAMVGDALQNNVVGHDALRTFGSMLGGGLVAYKGIAEALGQQPVLDPADSRFATVEINGARIGIGTTWIALARLAARIAEKPDNLLDTGFLDPTNNNPLVSFWRGRTAPVVGLAWDIAMKEDFGGNPVLTVPDVLKQAGTRLLPMAIAGLAETALQRPLGVTQASQFVGEEAGLRTFPAGVRDIRETVAQEQFGKRWALLTPQQQGAVEQDQRIAGLPAPQGARYQGLRDRKQIADEYSTKLEQEAQRVKDGTITASQFRTREHSLADERNTLYGHQDNSGTPPTPAAAGTPQAAFEQFMALIHQKNDKTGEPEYSAAEEYLNGLPPEQQQYIQDRQDAAYGKLGPQGAAMMKELHAAREVLKPYWDAQKVALQRVGLWDQWQNATPAEREQIVSGKDATARRYDIAQKRMAADRERLRLQNPAVDAALVKFYGLTPIRGRKR